MLALVSVLHPLAGPRGAVEDWSPCVHHVQPGLYVRRTGREASDIDRVTAVRPHPMSIYNNMKRQYNKGRFTVTECASLSSSDAPSSGAAPGLGPATPGGKDKASSKSKGGLSSIPEKTRGRVVKKGRFKVLTCLPCACDSAVKHFSDDEDAELLDTHSHDPDPWLRDQKLGPCEPLDLMFTTADDVGLANATSIKSADCARLPDQGPPASDVFSNCSWESASSLLSSLDSKSTCKTPRRVRFSEPGPTPVTSPTAASAIAISGTSGSPAASLPGPHTFAKFGVGELQIGPVVRRYKTGRFAVEEAFLTYPCTSLPVTSVVRSISCPNAMEATSCSRQARAAEAAVAALPQALTSPAAAIAAAAAAKPRAAAAAAAGAMKAEEWELEDAGEGSYPGRRHHTVSYFRRGRFLVQTVK